MERIILIGCGKAKQSGRHPAAALYLGSLFKARRQYAESREDQDTSWYILSAKYGLITSNSAIDSYDLLISQLAPLDRAAWFTTVAQQLLDLLPDGDKPRNVKVELHAGTQYASTLAAVLSALGFTVRWPVEHLGIGQQMAWYKRHEIYAKCDLLWL